MVRRVFISAIFLLITGCGSECVFEVRMLLNTVWVCTDMEEEPFEISFNGDGTGSWFLFGNFEWSYSGCSVELIGKEVTVIEITNLTENLFSFIFFQEGDKIFVVCQKGNG